MALEVLGDAWSLLIVRDLMFKGRATFQEFAGAGEGIATNVLADRLARLEEAGIITRRQDPTDARRVRYRLSEKGIDLAPMITELVLWSARYHDTAAPPETLRAMSRDRRRFLAQVRRQWGETEKE
jgi:DNA-binding HxlR family transcriptional regulator